MARIIGGVALFVLFALVGIVAIWLRVPTYREGR